MDRAEHLQWCKDRAMEYVDNGELNEAFASMISDMGKHVELDNPNLQTLGMGLMIGGHLDTVDKMRKWIQGFN